MPPAVSPFCAISLHAVRKDPGKGSLRVKLKRAGWSNDYLGKVLALF